MNIDFRKNEATMVMVIRGSRGWGWLIHTHVSDSNNFILELKVEQHFRTSPVLPHSAPSWILS